MFAHEAQRRPLPPGYRDEESPYHVPRNLRSYFVTVTAMPARNPLTAFTLALDAACDWASADAERRSGWYPR